MEEKTQLLNLAYILLVMLIIGVVTPASAIDEYKVAYTTLNKT